MRFEEVTVIRKTFCGSSRVLDGLNYNRSSAAMDVIFAPPGAGKSTFLEAAAGLIKPDSGRIATDGRAHFLMQVPERGFTSSTCLEEAGGELEITGLSDDIAGLSPWVLSRGERKRLALASILHYNRKERRDTLLMDDPFTDLDRRGAEMVLEVISREDFRVILATNRATDLEHFRRKKTDFRLYRLEKGKLIS